MLTNVLPVQLILLPMEQGHALAIMAIIGMESSADPCLLAPRTLSGVKPFSYAYAKSPTKTSLMGFAENVKQILCGMELHAHAYLNFIELMDCARSALSILPLMVLIAFAIGVSLGTKITVNLATLLVEHARVLALTNAWLVLIQLILSVMATVLKAGLVYPELSSVEGAATTVVLFVFSVLQLTVAQGVLPASI